MNNSFSSKFHRNVVEHLVVSNKIKLFLLILLELELILNVRQMRIVLYRYQGFYCKEIAKKLKLSPATISNERKKIILKLRAVQ